MSADQLIEDQQVIAVSDGVVADPGSWVYVWLGDGREVIYVGATGLPPTARTWLHLNDSDPNVGRIRADHPEALSGDIAVHAFRLRPGLDRRQVKASLINLLDGVGTDAVDAATEAARAIAARIAAIE